MTLSVVHWYPNFLAGGGVANSVLGLALSQAAAGANVAIVTAPHDDPLYGPLPTDPVNVVTFVSWGKLHYDKIRLHLLDLSTVRMLRSMRPDVVHVHGEFNPDNWWVPRLWRCPIVLSPHGAFHQAVLERRMKSKRLYTAVADHLLYRRVSCFHALNPEEMADIGSLAPAALAYCLPQGPSPAVEAMRGPARSEQRATMDPIRFLFVGRLDVSTKGLDILLEAFSLVVRAAASARPVKLTLVGPDWNGGRSYLTGLAHRLGIADSLALRSSIPTADVPNLFRTCDVYVQMSRHEGSPMSLNDALVLGKPVIISNRVGTASFEHIARLPHVQIVEPASSEAAAAISYAIGHLEALTSSGRQARSDLRAFLSWHCVARAHLQQYGSLLVGKASATGT